jgi:2,4-didehydro-3-deoxy-L-rhamnonate hydrolase
VRLATIIEPDGPVAALVRGDSYVALLPVGGRAASVRGLAAAGSLELDRLRAWAEAQPDGAFRPLAAARLGPVVPDPGAVFAIGLNYAAPEGALAARPERPYVYGKLPASVGGHGDTLSWDRSLSSNVDAEVELGVVIGARAHAVPVEQAMRHVFGYTCVDDVSSRDAWLDGDQWLLGKSMPGFCPVGPWLVTADELDPTRLRLGCTVNDVAIQDGSTAQLRFSIAEVIAFLSAHVPLEPGDIIATGTPARLVGPYPRDRHLEPGDVATVWIEGIGELTTHIA